MRVGFALPVSGSWATGENLIEIAGTAEELGYRSLWSFQRLIAPPDGSIGSQYSSVLDPVVALGMAAGVTRRVELGVAILNLPFASPAFTAKQLASLDVVSGGRLLAGFGLGWLPIEFEASNVPFAGRGKRADEYLAALQALWGPDPVRFDGELYQVPESMVLPKPVRPGGIPVLLGGEAAPALTRAGRLADGWISSSRVPPDELYRRIGQVKAAAVEAGRNPQALRFICRGVVLVGERTRPLTGSLEQIRDDVAALADQGITDVFIDLNFDQRIGNPDADPAKSMARARDVLAALAP